MEPILSVSHLEKVYGSRGNRTTALSDLSFDVLPGEFVGIMGASGSGKTTLLNCVSTIDAPTSGSITVDGTDVTALRGAALSRFRRERLGFIFQDCNLLDTLTGFENIALSLTILGTPAGAIDARVTEAAALLGLERVLDKYPYQMSGGEQQRVAAARAIITHPALVLADEPTGALDSKAAGAASPAALRPQPDRGRHHPHGHPRRLHRLLVPPHPLHQGRRALPGAAAGRAGPPELLQPHSRCREHAGR